MSLEGGKSFNLDERWSVTPQAKLIWSSLSTDSFHDVFKSFVEAPDSNSLIARIGIAANNASSWLQGDGTVTRLEIGAIANIYQNLKRPADYITITDEAGIGGRIKSGKLDRTWGELGLTSNNSWLNDKYAVYGKVSGAMGLENGKSHSITGNLGFRVKW